VIRELVDGIEIGHPDLGWWPPFPPPELPSVVIDVASFEAEGVHAPSQPVGRPISTAPAVHRGLAGGLIADTEIRSALVVVDGAERLDPPADSPGSVPLKVEPTDDLLKSASHQFEDGSAVSSLSNSSSSTAS
jgi:hypothetical protein